MSVRWAITEIALKGHSPPNEVAFSGHPSPMGCTSTAILDVLGKCLSGGNPGIVAVPSWGSLSRLKTHRRQCARRSTPVGAGNRPHHKGSSLQKTCTQRVFDSIGLLATVSAWGEIQVAGPSSKVNRLVCQNVRSREKMKVGSSPTPTSVFPQEATMREHVLL